MTNILLSFILITLLCGIFSLRRVLVKIKKAREVSAHDYEYVKEIITYLGRQAGYFNGSKKK